MSYINKRGKDAARRKMITRQQVSDVFSYGYIVTNKSNGKLTQRNLEKLITLSKKNTLESRRAVAAVILETTKYSKDDLLKKVFTEVSNRYKNRNGGYSRLLKLKEKDRVILSLV